MYKPGTDESNVQMSDVLCDFCHHEWLEDLPIIEGHRGAMICGKCLSVAYAEVVRASSPALIDGYTCRMCREGDEDRDALYRAGEAAWPSPLDAEAFVCRRCIELAASSLDKDEDHDWTP